MKYDNQHVGICKIIKRWSVWKISDTEKKELVNGPTNWWTDSPGNNRRTVLSNRIHAILTQTKPVIKYRNVERQLNESWGTVWLWKLDRRIATPKRTNRIRPKTKIIWQRPPKGNICVSKRVKMEILNEWKWKHKWIKMTQIAQT